MSTEMLRHCTLWEAWIQGRPPRAYRQAFIGRLFGRMALRSMTKDDMPLARNVPTTKPFRISETTEMSLPNAEWAALVEQYEHYSNPDFIHDFFGKMTREQIVQPFTNIPTTTFGTLELELPLFAMAGCRQPPYSDFD